jgi:hypothetical protein
LGERKPSQPNLTPQTPLIPERKSSNNEQVMDWMKSFNIPKRPLAASTARRPPQRVLSPVSPRIPQEQQQDGTWKLARRRVAPPPIHQYSNVSGCFFFFFFYFIYLLIYSAVLLGRTAKYPCHKGFRHLSQFAGNRNA